MVEMGLPCSAFFFRAFCVFSGCCCLLWFPRRSRSWVEPSRSPNVIFMMADDMGMGDSSAFQDFTGNSDEDQVHTPAMDRLARMGVRFTDAHTPSSRCSPTRYGLLTGPVSLAQSPETLGVVWRAGRSDDRGGPADPGDAVSRQRLSHGNCRQVACRAALHASRTASRRTPGRTRI